MITHHDVETLLGAGYLSAREVATMLDRHVNTVYRWCRAGTVDCQRVEGRLYVDTRSLLLLMGLDPDTGDIRHPGQLRLIAGGRHA